eukprot:GHVN01029590.1.p1 GENE.GHVN01029590.1~~GHVN01029590.1.p1  ORF type:complete len:382 (-),score=55.25 GHVN01029590.1:250-1395(-)
MIIGKFDDLLWRVVLAQPSIEGTERLSTIYEYVRKLLLQDLSCLNNDAFDPKNFKNTDCPYSPQDLINKRNTLVFTDWPVNFQYVSDFSDADTRLTQFVDKVKTDLLEPLKICLQSYLNKQLSEKYDFVQYDQDDLNEDMGTCDDILKELEKIATSRLTLHTGEYEGDHRMIKYEWPDGAVYEGEHIDGTMQGKGRFEWPDGEWYKGGWKDGKRHGWGKQVSPDRSWVVVESEHGKEKKDWPEGVVYEGEWKDGKKHGEGTQVWPGGYVYEGGWKHDQFDGEGKLKNSKETVYEGGWKDGKRDGVGEQVWPDTGWYTGGWKDDTKHGQGKQVWPDGGSYRGKWKYGKKDGEGRQVSPDGTLFEGRWVDGRRQAKKGAKSVA